MIDGRNPNECVYCGKESCIGMACCKPSLPAPTAAEQAQPVAEDFIVAYMRMCEGKALDHNQIGLYYARAAWHAALATPVPEQAQPAGVTEDARDAARYRWLRENGAELFYALADLESSALDAAVDNGMKEQPHD